MTYPNQVTSTQEPHSHLWTVEEYHQLVQAKLVGANEPAELIAGQIIRPQEVQSTYCRASIALMRVRLQQWLGDRALVRSQQPVLLGKHSEPKPDIAIVTGDVIQYRHHTPTPVEIALIIEVTDGSLMFDCGFKAIEYAQAGIQDYWVIDLSRWQLHIFRELAVGRYQKRYVLNSGDTLSPLAFLDLRVSLRECPPFQFLTRKLNGRSHHHSPIMPLLITAQAEPMQAAPSTFGSISPPIPRTIPRNRRMVTASPPTSSRPFSPESNLNWPLKPAS